MTMRPRRGCSDPGRRASSSGYPKRTVCRAGSAPRNSTTTSPSSPAPVLPAGGTGTALWTAPPPAPISVPALFVAGTDDPVGGFMRRDRTREVVTGPYREVMIDGAGHWLQQERPDQVNEVVLDFLS